MPKLFLGCLFLFLLSCTSSGQDSVAINRFIRHAEDHAIRSYYQFTGTQARLYNGIDHLGYPRSIKGNAYFTNDSLLKGSVIYDGLLFEQVPMIYDLYKDELVILNFAGLRTTLLSEKLKEFTLQGHHFERHVYDSLAKSSLPTGFYDHLYEGKIAVMVKRVKRLDVKITDQVVQEFLAEDRYIILKDGVYHSFRSYFGLLHVLKDKSRQVRRYLKRNKIKFKADRERAITEAVKFYISIS